MSIIVATNCNFLKKDYAGVRKSGKSNRTDKTEQHLNRYTVQSRIILRISRLWSQNIQYMYSEELSDQPRTFQEASFQIIILCRGKL